MGIGIGKLPSPDGASEWPDCEEQPAVGEVLFLQLRTGCLLANQRLVLGHPTRTIVQELDDPLGMPLGYAPDRPHCRTELGDICSVDKRERPTNGGHGVIKDILGHH